MSTSRTPTIGRIVHFKPHADHGAAEGEVFAAIVTKVNDDESLNLAAFDGNGNTFGVQNIEMVEDPSKVDAGSSGYCFWPPVGAAATAAAKS